MWIKLIPLVLGIMFLVVSMVIKYNVELRRSICTEQISAVIAGVTKHNIYDSDGPDTEIYTPVYNYVYSGSEYNVSCIFTCRARIGDSVTIFIAPSNPRVLYNPTENSRQVIVTFRTVAIILLAVTVILALFK